MTIKLIALICGIILSSLHLFVLNKKKLRVITLIICIFFLTASTLDIISTNKIEEQNFKLADSILTINKKNHQSLQKIEKSLNNYNLKLIGDRVVPIILNNSNQTFNINSLNQKGGQNAAYINNY